MFPLQRGAATWLFLVLTTLALAWTAVSAAENNQRVVCYYTNWSVYRPGTAKFNPQNINPYLCTHLIYSFGGFTKENALKPYDKYQDIEKGGFAKFTGLKTYNKNLKTMLAIGGWNEGSSRFSPLVADAERRSQFVKNSIKFLRQNHFDGLDLDWEYPAFRDGSKPKDRENYAQLVQELREEFERESSKTGRPRLLLTMAVPAGIEYIEKGYDVAKLNKYLDWFNLLTYDYHSAYEPAVNHHSPLYSLEEASEYNFDSELNIDYSIKFYLNAGADRDKLVLGIPTYGRSYTLYNPDATEIGSPADGPGEQGDATREKGYLAYYEICTAVKEDPEWTVVQPNPSAMGPYAYKGNQWVGYDDEAIARKKAKYVAENGLGGIMFWSIDNDDFRGTCHGKPYPIIEAAKETLLASTDAGLNDIAVPSSRKKPSRSRSRPATSTRNRLTTDNNNEIKSSFKSSQGRKNSRPAARATTTTTTSTTTEGSLYIGGRTTTPQPPTTPDPGADFKCTDEGFFQHPRDCKKYFWCLDAPGLGLVAHQFTCPSGLVFNKLADSCDYARNVVCSKTAPSTTTTTTTTSTSTTTTTTPAPRSRVTISTSRNNFFNRALTTTTTTEPPIEIDYSDEEEDEVQPEEDPQVIKELIALIKKVGGIEELERQLQAQEDGSIVLKSEKADQISTTQSTISKSLYERVLSRAGGGLQKFRPALTFTQTDKSGSTENKYSSVVRNTNTNTYTNSRVAPQNDGIEQLPEFEGVFKERPKYVTLNRARPTKPSIEEDADDRSDEEAIDEEENQPSTYSTRRPTTSPKYVSIRRQRPTTAADVEIEEEEEEENVQQPQQQQYSSVNRNRFRQTTTEETVEEVERVPSRYNTIERRRATAQYNRLQEGDKDDVGTDSSLLVPSTDYETIYTTSSTTDAPEQFITYNTRQYASVERSSTTEATPQTGGPSATDLTQSIPTTTTTTTSNAYNVQYNFNTDLQTDLPERDGPSDTVSDLDLSRTADSDSLTTDDAVTVDYSKNEPTYEVTTLLNLGESVTGSSVSELEASVFSSSVGASGVSVNPRTPESEDQQPSVMTTYDSEVSTTPVSPTTTTTVSTTSEKLTSTNDEQSNSIYKFSPRTRKTTTTGSPLEVVTNKQEFELTQTQAAPRPFSGTARRTRPTRRQTSSATTTTAVPEESTTLRSVKVRPQFRPALRRPGGPSSSFATTTSATPTTTPTARNKSTRRSESGETSTTDSTLLLTTTATPTSLLSRRRRPTTYLSKLNSANRQRPSVLGGSSTDEAAAGDGGSRRTAAATTSSTPTLANGDAEQQRPPSKSTRPKVGVRRKFGPTRTGSEGGGERGAAATTTTTTKSPDLETTTRTNLFKRRPGFLSPNRITTPAPPVTTFSSPASKFFKNRSKPSLATESPAAPADDQNPALLDGDVDQEIEPSIRQNSKLVNNKNRYNQIGEGDREGSLEDDLVGAITTISRAPLPSTTSRNFLFPNESPEDKNQKMQMMKILNIGELPASHQRASTHKYNITHDYTPFQSFSPEPFSTTRRSQKLIQRPRISTQSQFYYQQTTPSLYYSSSPVTLSPRKDTPRKRKPSSYEKSSYASANHRKQKDDFGGRTYRPAVDYDYYDDGEQRIIGKSSSQVKVIMHGPGIIECLDQGNFPHPLSCKKFISCAKMEIGGVVGWEYTCPKGLSYDPVGGICNWSAGLGCKD